MKIVKPMRLGVLARPYTLQRRHNLGIAVLAFASLDPRQPLLWPEADLWRVAGQALGEDGALDLGVPKPGAEFLVSGHAYTQHQSDKTCCAVRAEVAGVQKSLVVFGDRYWDGSRITPPEPFDAMPLDWAHTYGGPSFDENPAGIGADDTAPGRPRLPNIEPMLGRLERPRQAGVPVGFGPVSPVRPRRFRLAGSYDANWLRDGFPGFPDTLDARFFNAACADQWLPGLAALDTRAPYALWNMHPGHACLRGTLPGLRARCFVRRHATGQVLHEADMRLTTAWFFPGHERVLLIYHGAIEAGRDDAADITMLMPALEQDGAPARALEHYRGVLERRLHEEFGALHALRDKDLLPAGMLAPFMPEDASAVLGRPMVVNQKARADAMRAEARERAQQAGFDPDALMPVQAPTMQPPAFDDMGDFVLELRRRARQGKDDMEAARQNAQAWAAEAQAQAGMAGEPSVAAALQEGAAGGGPPRLRGGAFSRMRAMVEQAQAEQVHAGQVQRAGDGKGCDMGKLMDDAGERMAQTYRQGAHHLAPAARVSATRSRRMRARVQRLMEGSRNLSGLDLTGVDLSGMDLRGAQCRGTWMERANLTRVCLAGADLQDAVLVRARLSYTNLAGARLDGANLGGTVAREADFSHASLVGTVLDGAVLATCDFSHANLADCGMPDADVTDCRFDAATLDNVLFWQGARLSRLAFTGARMHRVIWLDCALRDLDFSGARLKGCAWVQSTFRTPARFDGAELETCCAVQTDLRQAVFAGAHLRECSLRDIDMDEASFDGATLERCDLSQASLRGARFVRANARGSLFMESDFRSAHLRDTDLIDALMQRSDLRAADMRGANLFRADVSQARLDPATNTAGAYTRLTKTVPARKGAGA